MVSEEAYAAVVAENQQLRQHLAEIQAQLAAALVRIAELEARPPAAPPAWVKANATARPPKPRRRRAAEHNHGRRREEPTQIVAHRPERCPQCQGRLSGVQVARRRQVIELPPPPAVRVTEHQVYRGWCSYCRAWRVAPLDLQGQVLGRGRLGVGIASLVAHLRLELRLPLRTIQRYLADRHGLRVSVGELVDLLRRVAAAGQQAYGRLRAQVQTSAVVQADETGWRENGRNGYIWYAGTPTGACYFAYHHSRAGQVINDLLGEDFGGVLGSDFYAAYNDTPGGRHQRCWVHLLRDLHTVKEAHPLLAVVAAAAPPGAIQQALEVHVWAQAVRAVYDRAHAGCQSWQAREAAGRAPPTPQQRQQAADAATAELVALGEQFAQQPTHPCHALAQRLLRHQDELFTFLRVAGVPPDNNAAERALRPLVVCRKISGGSRSPQGSQTRMVLTSLFQTWLAQGHNPLLACRQLLQSPLPQV
jgi:transposase